MTLIQPTFNELKTTFLAAKEILRLKSQLEKVKNQVERDPITGLNNRRGLSRRWKRESSLAKRYRHDLSVLFIDIDYFKSYNDQHGHSVGDQVLLAVSRLLKKTLREGDICARYGGDEFVIILPYTGLLEAQEVAERVRIQIESLHTPYSYSQPGGRLTLSIGVSSYPECSENVDEVWELADQALLEAKMKGKNQVCVKGQLDE